MQAGNMDNNELRLSVKNNILISFLLVILSWSSVSVFVFNYAIKSKIGHYGLGSQLEKALLGYMTTTMGLVTIFSALSAILIAIFIAKMITAPIPKLLKGIKELARGNMDFCVEIEAGNEFGLLAKAFNEMKADLKNMSVNRDVLEKETLARRRSQEFLKSILDSVGPLIVLDLDYKIIIANPGYCESVGIKLEQIIGKRCYAISHQSDKPCYINNEECGLLKVIETRKNYSVVHQHKKGDGFEFIQVAIYPVKDEKGAVMMVIETFTNITAQHNMEIELKSKLNELERFNKLAIGRELKMMELKENLHKLEEELRNKGV